MPRPTSPEGALERSEEIGGVIDSRLAIWARAAQSNYPALFHGGLARHIVRQCTPDPTEAHPDGRNTLLAQSSGEGDLNAHVSKREQRLQHEYELLTSIVGDDSLDLYDIEDEDLAESYERLLAIRNNPGVTEEYGKALLYLYRLYVQREQIAKQGRKGGFERFDFIVVLNRLLDDL